MVQPRLARRLKRRFRQKQLNELELRLDHECGSVEEQVRLSELLG